MDHRHLKVREREFGIERERATRCAQTVLTPRRMSQPECVTPVGRLDGHCTTSRHECLFGFPTAHQNQGQCRLRFSEGVVQFRGVSCVCECLIQQTAVRLVVRSSRLAPSELGTREAQYASAYRGSAATAFWKSAIAFGISSTSRASSLTHPSVNARYASRL